MQWLFYCAVLLCNFDVMQPVVVEALNPGSSMDQAVDLQVERSSSPSSYQQDPPAYSMFQNQDNQAAHQSPHGSLDQQTSNPDLYVPNRPVPSPAGGGTGDAPPPPMPSRATKPYSAPPLEGLDPALIREWSQSPSSPQTVQDGAGARDSRYTVPV